jgi:hypothetical protein
MNISKVARPRHHKSITKINNGGISPLLLFLHFVMQIAPPEYLGNRFARDVELA